MIRRISLWNWRAFERADIPFEDGTTFLVAPNGIGKSSLLEAAQFALSGRTTHPISPVMLGSESAQVELALQLPTSEVLLIRRTISIASSTGPKSTITLNDEPLTEAEFVAAVDRGFHSSPEFIARNSILRDSLRDVKHTNLRSLLARAFDLDAKRAEAEQLAALADDYKVAAEQLSREVRSEERAIGRLEGEVEVAVAGRTAADDSLAQARETLDAAGKARDSYLKAVVSAQRVAKWDEDASRLLENVRQFVPNVTLDTITALVDEFVQQVETVATALQEQAMSLQARLDLIDTALAELSAAGAECPVCRRPLDDRDRAAAEAVHRAEAAGLRDQLGMLDLEGALGRVSDARILGRQVIALGTRPDGPAASEMPPDPQNVFDSARLDLERAVAAQREAASKAEELEAALRSAHELVERSALSEQAWRRWALTSAASTALFKAIDDVIDKEVTPTRRAVTRRWNDLFRDRAGLEFDLDGNLWRLVNAEKLPIDGFSAGEQTAAKILMQLAILTTATSIDFCWFDEPLEHLDLRTRRNVASLLAQGRKATGLRQLVVTTYEEELAAHLADAEESAQIEYVRAGPMDDRDD